MKLPSIVQIGAEYYRTFRRFSLVLTCAALATLVAIILVEHDHTYESSILYNILLASILAFPFLTALKLTSERGEAGGNRTGMIQLFGIVWLAAYAITVPSDLPRAPLFQLFRFFGLGIGCCFLMSYLPFCRQGQVNGFWHFHRIIVFRIILAGAFAMVLFAGLALALAALDNLFGMEIPSERYFELWILIIGLFAVPFILSGVPEDLAALDAALDYPRPLKVLGQYVLLPLVLVYFVILYAYIAKIMVTWSWPQGWVGRLILGFSATGILALFVLDPLREKLETLWIKKASRWYYLILLPLIVILYLALWRRISEYGLTEARYLGLVVGAWLAIIAVYFIFSRSKSIKMIPVSLGAFAFLISVGPWSMFSVSEQSQIRRLKEILTADSILVNGLVQKASSPVSSDHEIQISAILAYLHEVHGFTKIEPWFTETIRLDTVGAESRFKDPADVAGLLGVEFNLDEPSEQDQYFSVIIDAQTPVSIAGYEQMIRAGYGGPAKVRPAREPVTSKIETTADSVIVKLVADNIPYDSVVIPIRPVIDRAISAYSQAHGLQIPGEKVMFEYETAGFKTKVVLLRAHFERQDSVVVVNSYEALIFYSQKSGD